MPGPPTPPAPRRARTTLSPASPRVPVYPYQLVPDVFGSTLRPSGGVLNYNHGMGMRVYRAGKVDGEGRRGGGALRAVLLVVLVLFVLLLVYLLVPLGGQRVVLLGSDARADEVSRSDTIVVAKAGGGMLAVPRDTLVDIPGVGEDKINVAFATGGPELTVETLEILTELPIRSYVVVHFDGVQDIVNALDGITLEVEEPI